MQHTAIIGHVGRTPEMSYTPTGTAVTKFSVAVTRKWNDKATGARKEETTWYNVTAFDTRAETLAQYVKKGHQVYLTGRVSARAYLDKEQKPACSLELTVETFELLSNPRDGGDSAAHEPTGDDFPF